MWRTRLFEKTRGGVSVLGYFDTATQGRTEEDERDGHR